MVVVGQTQVPSKLFEKTTLGKHLLATMETSHNGIVS
jgi:hypothetical protein